MSRPARGQISVAHARIIVATGTVIDRAELRAEFEASVLDYAKSESASRLAPIAKRREEWFADLAFEDRHRHARESRRAWVDDLEDGVSALHIVGPSVLVHAAHDRVSRLALATTGWTGADAEAEDSGTSDAAAVANLAHLCRRHPTLKHQTAWTVVQQPGGVLEWTSPAGIPYIDNPSAQSPSQPTPNPSTRQRHSEPPARRSTARHGEVSLRSRLHPTSPRSGRAPARRPPLQRGCSPAAR